MNFERGQAFVEQFHYTTHVRSKCFHSAFDVSCLGTAAPSNLTMRNQMATADAEIFVMVGIPTRCNNSGAFSPIA